MFNPKGFMVDEVGSNICGIKIGNLRKCGCVESDYMPEAFLKYAEIKGNEVRK